MMFFMMGRGASAGLEALLLMAATMVVFILLSLLFIGGAVLLFRWISQGLMFPGPEPEIEPPNSPLDALKEQYVSGSITLEEFEERLPEAMEKERKLEARRLGLRQRR